MTWIISNVFAILCSSPTLPNTDVMSEPSHRKAVLTIPIEVRWVFWIHGKQAVVPMLQSLSHDAMFPFSLVNFKRCGGAPLGCTEVGMPSFKALIQAICLLSLAFSGTGQSSCRYRCSIKSFSFRLLSPSLPWPQLKLHHILACVLACMLIMFRTMMYLASTNMFSFIRICGAPAGNRTQIRRLEISYSILWTIGATYQSVIHWASQVGTGSGIRTRSVSSWQILSLLCLANFTIPA